ncbi:sensor histidine kinase [Streptomyces altiplanensis]
MKAVVWRGVRFAAGLVIGAWSAVAELVFVLVSAVALLLVLAWPHGRQSVMRPVAAGSRRLTEFERGRLGTFLGIRISETYASERALRYLAARWTLGLLGAVVLVSVLIGAGYGTFFVYGWLIADIKSPGMVAFSTLGGLFLLFLAFQGIFGVASLEGQLARHFLGPSHQDELERRIAQLAASRAGVVEAVLDERRRIERDLHDGVQQHLVALGMLLGRARRSRDAEHAQALLRQAHEQSGEALAELREVAWRVYPTVLDEAGLRAALETVAERTLLPVHLDYRLEGEPAKAPAAVAYFVVSEAATNAVKHADATRLGVRLFRTGNAGPDGGRTLHVRVEDNGKGGADPSGSGLVGLGRRVAALDGSLHVDSPPGGPTTITAEIPCA